MEDVIRKVTRPQKSVDVLFVPDDCAGKIIKPYGSPGKPTGRRGGKVKTLEKDVSEIRNITCVTRSGRKITSKVAPIYVISEESEDSEECQVESAEGISKEEQAEKPTALFEEGDVAGSQMFGFQTPKRKNALANKASESASKASSEICTPKSDRSNIAQMKTPFSLRTQIKRKIVKEVTKLQEDVILEDSGSEYSPSESESESESSSEDDGVTPIDEVPTPSKQSQVPTATPHRRRKDKDSNYVFASDKYFETHSSKAFTSDHTLSKLNTPKLDQDQLAALLKSVNPGHQNSIKLLNDENTSLFRRWLFTLREGYSILLYGLGSKRNLLNTFHREYLRYQPVLVVNGYFPGLTLKEILDSLIDLLHMKDAPTQTNEIIDAVSLHLENSSSRRTFIIIHNLDGSMLRNDKSQAVLSQLAKIPKLHLLASVDHINCPLLWDQSKLSNYNFAWEDASSFLPYTEETSFESSIMVQRSGSLALAALKNVFQSLTTNSRNIFKLLLKYQLENNTKNMDAGMQFSELYRSCRDSFIVSSDLALRTQLTEFIDHQLVKWRKDSDHLIIPIESGVLKQFQREINEDEE